MCCTGMDEVVQKPLTPSVLRNICVRYGFPVKKQAPIPKDLFDKGHAFTTSFKQYVERCDPGMGGTTDSSFPSL